MELTATRSVNGTEVKLTATLSGEELTSDALSRIYGVLHREAERFAQIAYVDQQDQKVAIEEAQRIAKAPKDRPRIIVGAGTKDPDTVFVEHGEFHVGGKKKTAQPHDGGR
jgi:hypothetical protein